MRQSRMRLKCRLIHPPRMNEKQPPVPRPPERVKTQAACLSPRRPRHLAQRLFHRILFPLTRMQPHKCVLLHVLSPSPVTPLSRHLRLDYAKGPQPGAPFMRSLSGGFLFTIFQFHCSNFNFPSEFLSHQPAANFSCRSSVSGVFPHQQNQRCRLRIRLGPPLSPLLLCPSSIRSFRANEPRRASPKKFPRKRRESLTWRRRLRRRLRGGRSLSRG